MKYLFLLVSVLLSVNSFVFAQAEPQAPSLEFVMDLHVTCSGAISSGEASHGERVTIPITGGTFEGPKIKGVVLAGGADYQYVDKLRNRTELEAIYNIRTDDGITIHVRNCGILHSGKNSDGTPSFYFKTAPKFEAPADSKYGWLNNAIFVCAPYFAEGYIGLNVWMVK